MAWKLPEIREGKLKEILKEYEIELEERKNKWLELQASRLEKSKTELRKLAPDVYAFLYRNDRDWLNNNSPEKKRVQTQIAV